MAHITMLTLRTCIQNCRINGI